MNKIDINNSTEKNNKELERNNYHLENNNYHKENERKSSYRKKQFVEKKINRSAEKTKK